MAVRLSQAALAGRRAGLASLRVLAAARVPSHHPVTTRNFSSTTVVCASGPSTHWKYERFAAVGLLGLIPTGFIYPNAVVDYGLAFLIPLHGHWGYQSVIEDYVPRVLRVPASLLLYCVSIGAFAGLMYLNIKDVGICNAVKMVWSI